MSESKTPTPINSNERLVQATSDANQYEELLYGGYADICVSVTHLTFMRPKVDDSCLAHCSPAGFSVRELPVSERSWE